MPGGISWFVDDVELEHAPEVVVRISIQGYSEISLHHGIHGVFLMKWM